MKRFFGVMLCAALCLALCGCASQEEKTMRNARELIDRGEYSAARTELAELKTAEADALVEYCELLETVAGCDWTDRPGEYTYSDHVTRALNAMDRETLAQEYLGVLDQIQQANETYLQDVQLVDAAYRVVSEQSAYFDDYCSTLQSAYKRNSKTTFPVGDMLGQLDQWSLVCSTAADALQQNLPGITFEGLDTYIRNALTEPGDFWYDALGDKQRTDKVSYNSYRFDWEEYYREARTEVSNAVNDYKTLDYAAVWANAYAGLAQAPAVPAAQTTQAADAQSAAL